MRCFSVQTSHIGGNEVFLKLPASGMVLVGRGRKKSILPVRNFRHRFVPVKIYYDDTVVTGIAWQALSISCFWQQPHRAERPPKESGKANEAIHVSLINAAALLCLFVKENDHLTALRVNAKRSGMGEIFTHAACSACHYLSVRTVHWGRRIINDPNRNAHSGHNGVLELYHCFLGGELTTGLIV